MNYQDLTDEELKLEALDLSERIYNGTYSADEFKDSDFVTLLAYTSQLRLVYSEIITRQVIPRGTK